MLLIHATIIMTSRIGYYYRYRVRSSTCTYTYVVAIGGTTFGTDANSSKNLVLVCCGSTPAQSTKECAIIVVHCV
jgi:hypothetical protein